LEAAKRRCPEGDVQIRCCLRTIVSIASSQPVNPLLPPFFTWNLSLSKRDDQVYFTTQDYAQRTISARGIIGDQAVSIKHFIERERVEVRVDALVC